MSSWTAFFWGDYLRDTMDLSLTEHGAYIKLLAHYYSTGGPLPSESRALHRICGVATQQERSAVTAIVKRYFQYTAEGYRHTRADEEIDKRQRIARNRSEAGKRSAASRQGGRKVTQFPGNGGSK